MKHPDMAIIPLLAGGCIIGLSPIFVRLSDTGPVATAFWRLFLALIPFTIWTHKKKITTLCLNPRQKILLALAGLFFATDLSIWHLSIGYTTVANSTLLANFAPIFVALGSWFIFRIRMGKLFFAGMVLALTGMFLLVGISAKIGSEYLTGDLLALSAAVFYAAYMLTLKQLREFCPTPTILLWVGLTASVVLLPTAILLGERVMPAGPDGWLANLGLALICHFLGQSLITYAVAHLPAHFTSVTLLIQPVVAAGVAALLFSELLNPLQAAGGLVVLLGIYLARQDTTRKTVVKQPV